MQNLSGEHCLEFDFWTLPRLCFSFHSKPNLPWILWDSLGAKDSVSAPTWFRRCVLSSSYVSLCDNEKTGCKARELKSVYVDAVGQFLKLIFHQNHVNKYNVYNQVRRMGLPLSGVSPHRRTCTLPSGCCLWGSARLAGAVPPIQGHQSHVAVYAGGVTGPRAWAVCVTQTQ